jgi:hypothetical protein
VQILFESWVADDYATFRENTASALDDVHRETAKRGFSLYFDFMSSPVCSIVSMTASSETQ